MQRRDFITATGVSALGIHALLSPVMAATKPKWQPDGAGLLGKIGILTPQGDAVPESEVKAIAPPGISIHSSIVKWDRDPNRKDNFKRFLAPPNLEGAIELLLAVAPKSILFGFTSTSYVDGPEGDPPLVARIEKASKGIPVILPTLAATEALRFLGARRISIVHQPWFSAEANSLGREYFQKVGFDVMSCTRVEPLRRTVEEVPPAEIYDWVVSHTPSKADAVFIGGNGGRVIGAIDAIEKRLKKTVITANQVLLWSALHRIGLASKVKGYGRVFSAG